MTAVCNFTYELSSHSGVDSQVSLLAAFNEVHKNCYAFYTKMYANEPIMLKLQLYDLLHEFFISNIALE
jgi:hypothetical protein